MFPIPSSTFNGRSIGAKVHTIGTETWKDVEVNSGAIQGSSSFSLCGLSPTAFRSLCPTYLNGFLYWYCEPYGGFRFCLVSFDIENECFESISLPPLEGSMRYDEVSVGVFGGELSISWFTGVIQVWIMKDFGTTNVWSKVLSVRIASDIAWLLISTWIPVKYLNDGALLMFNSSANCFMYKYKYPRKHGIRYFRFHGVREQLEAISHIASFVSLEDALGHHVKVLKPRCTELKVQDEDRSISLRETNEVTFVKGGFQGICEIIL